MSDPRQWTTVELVRYLTRNCRVKSGTRNELVALVQDHLRELEDKRRPAAELPNGAPVRCVFPGRGMDHHDMYFMHATPDFWTPRENVPHSAFPFAWWSDWIPVNGKGIIGRPTVVLTNRPVRFAPHARVLSFERLTKSSALFTFV